MWFAPRPVARVPSWQEAQLPMTWVWSTLVGGDQAATLWQASQLLLAWMWDGLFAVAGPPGVWHETQFDVMFA